MRPISLHVPIRLRFGFFQHLSITRIHRNLKIEEGVNEDRKRRNGGRWRSGRKRRSVVDRRTNRHNLPRYGQAQRANLRMARVLDRLDCVSRINETLESGFVYDLCNVTKHRKMLSRCKTSEERKCGRGRASTDEVKGVRRVEIFETSTAIFRQFGGRILASTNCIDPTSIAE